MILAGTSPKVCAECGGPWERVTEQRNPTRTFPDVGKGIDERKKDGTNLRAGELISTTLGWRPTCSCNAGTKPATVADIFCGTATVAEKCIEHGRDYVMIDIDPKSIEMAEERIAQVQIRLPLMIPDHDL